MLEKIKKETEEIGFSYDPPSAYVYEGSNPSLALAKLVQTDPFVVDCESAENASFAQAISKLYGDHALNRIIDKSPDKKLLIAPQQNLPLPWRDMIADRTPGEKHEAPLPTDLRQGDHIHLGGAEHGYAFHPGADLNDHNVLVDIERLGSPELLGFASQASHGSKSYDEWKQEILKKYNEPLTYRDLFLIKYNIEDNNGDEPVEHSSYSFRAVDRYLSETQPENMKADCETLATIENSDIDDMQRRLDEKTGLLPPKATSILGVLQHHRLNDMDFS